MPIQRSMLCLTIVCVAVGCGAEAAAHTAFLARSTPEAQGVPSGTLVTLLEEIRDRELGLHSLMVVRHGQIVLDATFFPYDGRRPHDIASCTKSLTSTAIGVALGEGKIRSLDRPLLAYLEDLAPPDVPPDESAITLAQALSMTSGFDCVTDPVEQTLSDMQSADDWLRFALAVPMATRPGTSFRYCSTVMHLLSGVVTRATGRAEDDYLWDTVLQPIGAQRPEWPRDPQGISHGWGDARLFPESMARVGQLFLQHGELEGRALVPRDFVAAATSNRDGQLAMPAAYGYGWWTTNGVTFYADGRGGQLILVAPRLDVVVVTTAGASAEQVTAFRMLLNEHVAAGGLSAEALPDNPEAQARLAELVAQARLPPMAADVSTLPEQTSAVSGVEYALSGNMLGWEQVALSFGRDAASLRLQMGERRVALEVGLDAVARISRDVALAALPGFEAVDVAMRGSWVDEHTFVIVFDTIETIGAGTLRFAFGAGGITLTVEEKTFLHVPIAIQGTPVPD